MTQPTTMIERMARAVYCADEGIVEADNLAHVDYWFGPDPGDPKESWSPDFADHYRHTARAALRTLLEPSEEMIEAGADASEAIQLDMLVREDSDRPEALPDYDSGDVASSAFRSMILSALGEGDPA